ncbi:E3 ubiquitin-protein ligase Siah2 [Rhipicephalus microplus]|uniref:E3 ubiquitin-protein ligase Siah2 n=1 Tax=Rhipicephalus microplus TaxID=6941 RepID=UPI003F6AB02E
MADVGACLGNFRETCSTGGPVAANSAGSLASGEDRCRGSWDTFLARTTLFRDYKVQYRIDSENVVVTATNFRRVEAFCWVALQTCLGRDFVVMLRKRNNRVSRNHFFGAVLLIGLSEEALRFLYRFELRGAEPALVTETERSGGGLVLDMSTAERLCNGADLILGVTVSVAPSLSGDNVL